MGIMDKLMSRTPDKPIYHYTSQSGLLGIVNNRYIWATNIEYLNDSLEFSYAIEIARNEIQYIVSTGIYTQQMLNELTKRLFMYNKENVFVSSFSENADLLSQWRGYCPHGNGFSLGFDFNRLLPLMVEQGFTMAPCVYEVETQKEIVSELIATTIESFQDFLAEGMIISQKRLTELARTSSPALSFRPP